MCQSGESLKETQHAGISAGADLAAITAKLWPANITEYHFQSVIYATALRWATSLQLGTVHTNTFSFQNTIFSQPVVFSDLLAEEKQCNIQINAISSHTTIFHIIHIPGLSIHFYNYDIKGRSGLKSGL